MSYDQILYKQHLAESDWENLLNYETQFLPQPEAFLKKTKPVDLVSELEALIECEYLIQICLHHQKWYYRLSKPQIDDALYDQLEERIWDCERKFPHILSPNNLIKQVGY